MSLDLERRVRMIEDRLSVRVENTYYDSGTWTPAFTGTTIAGTFTYLGAVGLWTRFGNNIFIHAYVQISAISVSPTGNMTITGLPYTADNLGVDFSLAIGFASNINTSANIVQLTAIVRLNTARIDLYEAFDNVASTQYPAANFTNANAAIELSGVYRIA